MQKITLMGFMRNVEPKESNEGKAFTTFLIPDENSKGVTTWWNCMVTGKFNESIAEYLENGKGVYIEGNVELSAYINSEGDAKPSNTVFVRELKFTPSVRPDADESTTDSVSTDTPKSNGDEVPTLQQAVS